MTPKDVIAACMALEDGCTLERYDVNTDTWLPTDLSDMSPVRIIPKPKGEGCALSMVVWITR